MRYFSQDEGGVCRTQRRLFRRLTVHSQAVLDLEFQMPISLFFALPTPLLTG